MQNIRYPLFFTRVTVFYFLLPWVLMRFVATDKAANIAGKYYFLGGMPEMLHLVIGIAWLVLLIAFVIGFQKKWSYGLVLFLHALGTVFTIPYLIIGTEQMKILFFAAIPVVGAMWLLYCLRDKDTLLSVS